MTVGQLLPYITFSSTDYWNTVSKNFHGNLTFSETKGEEEGFLIVVSNDRLYECSNHFGDQWIYLPKFV